MSNEQAAAAGIDITIYDDQDESTVAVPKRVFIEGREVFVPEGTHIDLSSLSSLEAPTVTLTMFVRNFALRSGTPETKEN